MKYGEFYTKAYRTHGTEAFRSRANSLLGANWPGSEKAVNRTHSALSVARGGRCTARARRVPLNDNSQELNRHAAPTNASTVQLPVHRRSVHINHAPLIVPISTPLGDYSHATSANRPDKHRPHSSLRLATTA